MTSYYTTLATRQGSLAMTRVSLALPLPLHPSPVPYASL
ncbi:hypothetical protein E2C01_097043 [Portunus trituberculatus]|uniref:Uncharacterized protein n=1 Tax=Portunus trituberculatus TaxID=210409 RepID=A0A5B7JU55_PORTR|nr:hypothetical protein [Portunus trituberculatus]